MTRQILSLTVFTLCGFVTAPILAEACVGPSYPMRIYLGKGKPGDEELQVILNPENSKQKKSVKIVDNDGLANLFLMSSLTKGKSEPELQQFKSNFVASLKKAEASLAEALAMPESQNHKGRKEIERSLAETKELIFQLKEAPLARKHFGAFMHKVFLPLSKEDVVFYAFRDYKDGQFKPQTKDNYRLSEILPKGAFEKISGLTEEGGYMKARSIGNCGNVQAECANCGFGYDNRAEAPSTSSPTNTQ